MKKSDENRKKMDAKIGNMDSYLGYWLRFVSNQVSASFQQRLSEKEVTVAEWIALRFLFSHSPCSLTKLADEMGMDKGAVSRLVDRLEKRAFITREFTFEDRRLSSIQLTSSGEKIVPALAKIADENDKCFFGHLSKKEVSQITDFLKDIVNRHGFKSKPIS
jgi:DNA-binding MarR family transcriptional regulator